MPVKEPGLSAVFFNRHKNDAGRCQDGWRYFLLFLWSGAFPKLKFWESGPLSTG
jgi:hypothetical protein